MAERERDDDLLLPQQRGEELVAQRVGIEGGERAVELVGPQCDRAQVTELHAPIVPASRVQSK